MQKALEIARFELLDQARRSANYVFFGLLFLLGLGVTAYYGSRFQDLMGSAVPTLANAPRMVTIVTRMLMMLGLIAMSGSLFGRLATKDADVGFDGLLITTGVGERPFLAGRLAAAWVTACAIFLAVPLGLIAGLLLPSTQPDRTGPFTLLTYAQAYAWHVIPNVIVIGTALFALATVVRRTLWVYAGAVALIAFPGLLLVPFDWVGLETLKPYFRLSSAPDVAQTATWMPAEANTQAMPVPGALVINRLVWLAVAAGIVGVLIRWFRFSREPFAVGTAPGVRQVRAVLNRLLPASNGAIRPPAAPPAAAFIELGKSVAAVGPSQERPRVEIQTGAAAGLRQLRARTAAAFAYMAGSKWFWLTVAVGAFLAIQSGMRGTASYYDAPVYPTTAHLLGSNAFVWPMALFLFLMLGETLWRERDCQFDSLVDATPAPNWVLFGALLLAVAAVQALALLIYLVACVLVQIATRVPVDVGAIVVSLFTIRLVLLSVLLVPVLLAHVVVGNKYVGHFVGLLFFVLVVFFPRIIEGLGVPRLAIYGTMPDVPYSDMNGFGHYLGPLRWFQLYWALLAVVLLFAAQLLWTRGAETGLLVRWRQARERLTGRLRLGLSVAVACWLAVGGWIHYNTRILHQTPRQLRAAEFGDPNDRAAQLPAIRAYVEKYRQFHGRQLSLAGLAVEIEAHPRERRMDARATFTLENRTAEPVSDLLLADRAMPALTEFAVDGAAVSAGFERVNGARMYRFALPAPVPPGGRVQLAFSYARRPPRGFAADVGEQDLLRNGMNVYADWLPMVGYVSLMERVLNSDPAAEREAEAKDAPGTGTERVHGEGADWQIEGAAAASDALDVRSHAVGLRELQVPFEGVICTDADQTGVLPGTFEREWLREDGRRCFAYRAASPMRLHFHAVSGRYVVKRERLGDVDVEVYHHPGHPFNADVVLKAMKSSLDLFGAAYGPYQFKALRITEVPYLSAAISTPGMAVFGEPFGFTTRIDRRVKGAIDFPYFVVAHETAHQWWGEQVIPARAKGYAVMLETLTQYSAVKSIEREYGPEGVRGFLEKELRSYLSGRVQGTDVPLAAASNQQYVVYNKGAVAMFALRDALGAAAVDGALSGFLQRYAGGPPFPLSSDLMDALRAAAPPERQHAVADLLQTITFWYLKTDAATFRRLDNGRFEVTLEVQARKVRADAVGNETSAPMAGELIDVGVLDAQGAFLYLQKHPISEGKSTITVEVDKQPRQAGLDPVLLLIDRAPQDNLVTVRAGK